VFYFVTITRSVIHIRLITHCRDMSIFSIIIYSFFLLLISTHCFAILILFIIVYTIFQYCGFCTVIFTYILWKNCITKEHENSGLLFCPYETHCALPWDPLEKIQPWNPLWRPPASPWSTGHYGTTRWRRPSSWPASSGLFLRRALGFWMRDDPQGRLDGWATALCGRCINNSLGWVWPVLRRRRRVAGVHGKGKILKKKKGKRRQWLMIFGSVFWASGFGFVLIRVGFKTHESNPISSGLTHSGQSNPGPDPFGSAQSKC
jgi:hypothetical protein